MGKSWTEAYEKDALTTTVQVLCSTRSPLEAVQISLEPVHLPVLCVDSSWCGYGSLWRGLLLARC